MTTIINEKLNALFSDENFCKTVSKENLDDLYNAVVVTIPEVSKSELAEYVVALGKAVDLHQSGREISESELDDVSGGAIGFLTLVVAGAVTVSGLYLGAQIGKWAGEAIAYLTE